MTGRTSPTLLLQTLLLLGALVATPAWGATPPPPDTVRVAPPTGSADVDRVRVQEAFDRVQPGDTVLFAPGTYMLGEGARLTVPDVTVLGHPDGTVLQGCAPERFEFPADFDPDGVPEVVFACTGLSVLADRQTIRGLTFEHAWHGLVIGHLVLGPPEGGRVPPSYGGHRIEQNVFRHTPNGIRILGPTEDVTVIRDNVVLNAFHAFQSNGAPVHVLDNRISAPDPASVPASHHPESGVILSPGAPGTACRGSVVAGNVIEGTVNGIQVLAYPGEEPCTDHEIRGNIIRLGPVPLPAGYPAHLRDYFFGPGVEGSTVTGIAIRLRGGEPGGDATSEPTIRNVLIQDNRILGATGLGIQIVNATGTRIVGNHVADIRRRSPLNGPTWGDRPGQWSSANGAAIWIAEGSNENVVAGNTFHEIEGAVVHVAGNGNDIRLREPDPRVVDEGQGNRILTSHPTSDEAAVLAVVDSAPARVSAEDLVGFTDLMVPGAAVGAVGERDGQPYHGMRTREEQRQQTLTEDVVERGFDAEVMLSGPIAMVWLPYDLHRDGTWSHCGVDVFTLFRTEEGWRIASILYSYEQPPGCRRHPGGPPGR